MTLLKTLPRHVVAPQRADKTHKVMFRVRKDRPDGWPSSIPLPIEGERQLSPDAPAVIVRRRGNLNDPIEVAAILADAERYTARLEAARTGAKDNGAAPGTMPALAASWEASWSAEELRARTRNFYRKNIAVLLRWSEKLKHPQVSTLPLPTIIKYLDGYKDRPAMQAGLRRTMSAMFSHARDKGEIDTHPLGVAVRMKRKKRRRLRPVELWDNQISQTYTTRADARGWTGGGNMISLMWETSADGTDVVTWRKRTHFLDGAEPAIKYTRGKTGEETEVPISHALAARLRKCFDYLVTDPDGQPYEAESVQADNRRGRHFMALRDDVVAAGGVYRILDHLRHSAVTDALSKGAQKEHVPSLTAHRGSAMNDAVYSQLTRDQARQVQKARGII